MHVPAAFGEFGNTRFGLVPDILPVRGLRGARIHKRPAQSHRGRFCLGWILAVGVVQTCVGVVWLLTGGLLLVAILVGIMRNRPSSIALLEWLTTPGFAAVVGM
jgi:hypothetical protein